MARRHSTKRPFSKRRDPLDKRVIYVTEGSILLRNEKISGNPFFDLLCSHTVQVVQLTDAVDFCVLEVLENCGDIGLPVGYQVGYNMELMRACYFNVIEKAAAASHLNAEISMNETLHSLVLLCIYFQEQFLFREAKDVKLFLVFCERLFKFYEPQVNDIQAMARSNVKPFTITPKKFVAHCRMIVENIQREGRACCLFKRTKPYFLTPSEQYTYVEARIPYIASALFSGIKSEDNPNQGKEFIQSVAAFTRPDLTSVAAVVSMPDTFSSYFDSFHSSSVA